MGRASHDMASDGSPRSVGGESRVQEADGLGTVGWTRRSSAVRTKPEDIQAWKHRARRNIPSRASLEGRR